MLQTLLIRNFQSATRALPKRMNSEPIMSSVPSLSHVFETCLYVRDINKSVSFYRDVFSLEPYRHWERSAFFAVGKTTLILFQLGLTAEDYTDENGYIPGHGPSQLILDHLLQGTPEDGKRVQLKQHFCFATGTHAEVDAFDARLTEKDVKILGRMNWERGGRSVYFEDPDGHIGEVASRGMGPHY